jgi:chromosome partitioning protein
MLVYAISNHKGGVGKTTSAINLGAAFAQAGRRVLLLDLDPQGCLTASVGGQADGPSMCDALNDPSHAVQAIIPCSGGMHLIPAKATLAVTLHEIARSTSAAFRLTLALQTVERQFDIALIDCPSALGSATTNALTAADVALVPMQCDFLSLRGLADLQAIAAAIQETTNPDLRLRVAATLFDKRTSHSSDILREAREALPGLVFQTLIPRSIRLAEAPATGHTILDYAPRSLGAEAYRALAQEIMQEENTYGTTRRYSGSNTETALLLQTGGSACTSAAT